jgi:septum formation protein
MEPIVLASASPQRRAILEQLGVPFVVRPAAVEEVEEGDPATVALTNARAKAAAVEGEHVLGVDTVVALDGEIFGKPATAQAALQTLTRLSGRTHEVVSGLALLRPGNPQVVHEVTEVTFRELGEELIERYVGTLEWSQRAGGYAIQGQGGALVRAISGNYLNVVGLPVAALLDLDLSLMLREE